MDVSLVHYIQVHKFIISCYEDPCEGNNRQTNQYVYILLDILLLRFKFSVISSVLLNMTSRDVEVS
jgi:hypothetical protein